MKLKEFDYKKEDKVKGYKILVLHEDDKYVKGINVQNLSPEEAEELFTIQSDYEDSLKKFMKNYRQFKKENILKDY
ncbi:MAG: hypothetical protein ACOC3V_00085 [bacterium]